MTPRPIPFRVLSLVLAIVAVMPLASAATDEIALAPTADFDVVRRLAFASPMSQAIARPSNSTRLFAGFGPFFTVLSVADVTRPTVLGTVELDAPVVSIVPDSNSTHLFALAGKNLYVIDATYPGSPSIAATLALPEDVRSAALGGSHLYVGTTGKVVTINVSSLSAPVIAHTVTLPNACDAIAAPAGGYLYALSGYSLLALNAANPAAPSLQASVALGGFGKGIAYNWTGSHLVVTHSNGLSTYSLDNRALPAWDGELGTITQPWNVVVQGRAFVASQTGLHIVDLADPSQPTQVGSVALDVSSTSLVLFGGTAFVLAPYEGIKSVDVSDPAAPVQVGAFDTVRSQYGIAVSGGSLYSAGLRGGVLIVDLAKGRPVARYRCGDAFDVAVAENRLYVATDSGLKIVDVARPQAPTLISELSLGNRCLTVDLAGRYAFLIVENVGLMVVDVADPAAPTLVATTPSSLSYAYDSELSGDALYVVTDSDLRVFDVADPGAPRVASSVALGYPLGVSVSNGRAFVTDFNDGLQIFDVGNPAAPLSIGSWVPPAITYDSVVQGNLAYVTDSAGLHVLDIADPQSPVELATYPGGSFGWLHFADGNVFSSGQGLYQFHYVDQCWDPFEPNDDPFHATPVTPGQVHEGKLCDASDQDWFTVTPESPGTVQFALDVPAGHLFRLFVRDRFGRLVASSAPDGAREVATFAALSGMAYSVTVQGVGGDHDPARAYLLSSTFAACAGPTQPLYIRTVTLDDNANAVLEVLDPNQPASITGYNVFRSTRPGDLDLLAENVVDMDQGVPNVQYVDTSAPGELLFYRVTAFNATCGLEGP